MAYSKAEREEAVVRLKEHLKRGDIVFTIARHVASSGMQRTIQLITFHKGRPLYLGYNAAIALDMPYDKKYEGIKIRGAGMDMGFALVDHLSHALFGDSRALKQEWL